MTEQIPCNVCCGVPSSVDNCICGGAGTQSGELHGLRKLNIAYQTVINSLRNEIPYLTPTARIGAQWMLDQIERRACEFTKIS